MWRGSRGSARHGRGDDPPLHPVDPSVAWGRWGLGDAALAQQPVVSQSISLRHSAALLGQGSAPAHPKG